MRCIINKKEKRIMILQDLQKWEDKLIAGSSLATPFFEQHKDLLYKKKIAFFGMGGSGIAGSILKTFFDQQAVITAYAINSSEVPAYITPDTLCFVSSYSGNTWESLSVLNQLIERNIPVVIITHGGTAHKRAQQHKLPVIVLPEAVSPRAALGYFLGIFLTLFDHMKLLDGHKMIASFIAHSKKHIPQYADEHYFDDFISVATGRDFFHVWGITGESEAFAYRAQTQFNENSKSQAVFSVFSELCHNLIVGFTSMHQKPLVLLCHTDYLAKNLQKALAATQELLEENGIELYKIPILGDTFEEQLFNIILWSDFASYYLGVKRGVEVNPVKLIDGLKQKHTHKGISV